MIEKPAPTQAASSTTERRPVPSIVAVSVVGICAYAPFLWIFLVPHGQGSTYLAMFPIAPGGIFAVAASMLFGGPPNSPWGALLCGLGTFAIWFLALTWSRRTPLRLGLTAVAILASSAFFSFVTYQVYRM